jgi:hypothetical protein
VGFRAIFSLVAALLLQISGAVPVAAQNDPARFKILSLEGNNVRWQSPRGEPFSVTYGIATSAMEFPGARNCRKIGTLADLVETSALDGATVVEEINAAFAMWEAVADIRFRLVRPGEDADIMIGAQLQPEGWAFADVFYDQSAATRVKPISKSLICLNPLKHWKVGFDGDLKTYDLRYTIAHEIGHAIGLDHPVGAGQIMGYRYEERFRTLQPGDVTGAVVLYGQPKADSALVAKTDDDQQTYATRMYAKGWVSRALTSPGK